MKLTAVMMAASLAPAVAVPGNKVCTTQTGSDSMGVPIFGTDFTAMGTTWTQDDTLTTDFYQVRLKTVP